MNDNSPQRKTSNNREIPGRRVVISDASQLPIDYSSTPGGTIFSTTPGGMLVFFLSFYRVNVFFFVGL